MEDGRRQAGLRDISREPGNPTSVTKHLVDLDEDLLSAARAQLGTRTIKDTVNEALRRATHERQRRTAAALDVLAGATLDDRSEAWR